MTLVFPDVCKTPSPPPGVPIPYPTTAITAIAQKQAASAARKMGVSSASKAPVQGSTSAVGIASGPGFAVAGAPQVKLEGQAVALQVEAQMSNLHATLRTLPARDPNQWQHVLEQYVAAAAALYLLKRDDD